MAIVAHPQHALASARRPGWAALAREPWVMPPPWASSRVKLNQQFYKHGLVPPVNIVESSSFLVTLSFVRDHGALGFVAQSVAKHLEREGLTRALRMKLEIELPPVGLITTRQRLRSPACEQLMDCLRRAARSR